MSNPFQQALQSAPTVTVAPPHNILTVIERFEVPPTQQAAAMELVTTYLQHWQTKPDFVGAIELRSRDKKDDGISEYAQWYRAMDEPVPGTPLPTQSLRVA